MIIMCKNRTKKYDDLLVFAEEILLRATFLTVKDTH